MSLKCPECGLINFDSATACKKCQAPLSFESDSANIWQDGNYLVVNVDSFTLPSRCLKCNTSLNLSPQVLEMKFYPLYSYFLVLFSRRVVFWTHYEIPAFLCGEHYRIAVGDAPNTMLPNLLIVLGIFALIMGIVAEEAAMLLLPLGIALLGFGLLLFKLAKRDFKITKRAKSLIWIKGVAPQYLALLPAHR